jgi:hypothetical protein
MVGIWLIVSTRTTSAAKSPRPTSRKARPFLIGNPLNQRTESTPLKALLYTPNWVFLPILSKKTIVTWNAEGARF